MTNTLKVVLVPMRGYKWKSGMILKSLANIRGLVEDTPAGSLVIAVVDNDNPVLATYHQPQQLLLIDEKAEIKEGDTVLHKIKLFTSIISNAVVPDTVSLKDIWWKVIASQPHLPNTIPLSPSTIQAIAECNAECEVRINTHNDKMPVSYPDGFLLCEVVPQLPHTINEVMDNAGVELPEDKVSFWGQSEQLIYEKYAKQIVGMNFGQVDHNKEVLKYAMTDIKASVVADQQQHSEQLAVEFADWMHNNQFRRYLQSVDGPVPFGPNKDTKEPVWVSTKIHYSPGFYTSSQLFKTFMQWKNKA